MGVITPSITGSGPTLSASMPRIHEVEFQVPSAFDMFTSCWAHLKILPKKNTGFAQKLFLEVSFLKNLPRKCWNPNTILPLLLFGILKSFNKKTFPDLKPEIIVKNRLLLSRWVALITPWMPSTKSHPSRLQCLQPWRFSQQNLMAFSNPPTPRHGYLDFFWWFNTSFKGR